MQSMCFQRPVSTFTEDRVILKGLREGALESFNSHGNVLVTCLLVLQ